MLVAPAIALPATARLLGAKCTVTGGVPGGGTDFAGPPPKSHCCSTAVVTGNEREHGDKRRSLSSNALQRSSLDWAKELI